MAPKMVPKMAPLKIPLLNVYIWDFRGSRYFSRFFETVVFGARTARAWIGSGASSGGYPRGSFPNGEGRGQVIIHKGPYGLQTPIYKIQIGLVQGPIWGATQGDPFLRGREGGRL